MKDLFCSYCGASQVNSNYPKHCMLCNNITFSNPLPVSVALINVWENDHLGVLIQQRNINPKKGEWALTGGYIDRGESWQEGLVREVREELGLETTVNDYKLVNIMSSVDKSTMLVFGTCTKFFELNDIHFVPNSEVSAIKVIHEPISLAFPSHTEVLRSEFSAMFSSASLL